MNMDQFINRHIGPRDHEISEMLDQIGASSMDDFIDSVVPADIRLKMPLNLPDGMSEAEYADRIKEIGEKNKAVRSYIGMGYYGTVLPAVIKRNVLENPSWYTSYTPYQAEISQGRLEALLNYQTMVMELTGMEIANASLLDEGTAAAEAMIMMFNKRSRALVKSGAKILHVDKNIFPQTLSVLETRAKPLGIEIRLTAATCTQDEGQVFGIIVQYPSDDGKILNHKSCVNCIHKKGGMITVIADLMSLVLLAPPGDWGADIVVGSTQRFGVPMGFGGPHAGFFATRESLKRSMPGRIIGISVDQYGNKALRMALQTREQHIKREKATSNICTAQALLAIMAGLYAAYHGPKGLKDIALRIHQAARSLEAGLKKLGYIQENKDYFDTLRVVLPEDLDIKKLKRTALQHDINLRYFSDDTFGISTDELSNDSDISALLTMLAEAVGLEAPEIEEFESDLAFDPGFERKSDFLQIPCFNRYHSETEMMRYIKKLERRDISLTQSMIPLGSCTMKLNAANSLFALSWGEFANIHPFVPEDQVEGYAEIIDELEQDLAEITGFPALSFQPNSGAAGEYAGLLVIKQYHEDRSDQHKDIVLIPASAHGTNPASAIMAGGKVVVVKCDEAGNVDIEDLKAKAVEHKDNLMAFMVTYPSTHGVFESGIREMTDIIHTNGGLVYMDGANMNAQVGLTNPATIGADVCHLNLHKTFGIPHGGGGPGVGPIGVAEFLKEYLPSHPVVSTGGKNGGVLSSAPYGSALVLTITHAYIKMLGGKGLTRATEVAMLSANYLATHLNDHYGVLYSGDNGRVAHEMILDCRSFKLAAGIETSDIARRLMDYGFHAPTLSFPVHETLMVEPTESESKQELDRFIETMVAIRHEISDIVDGLADPKNNVLINAPHTAMNIGDDTWSHPYGRQKAAFPLPWVAENKFWPLVSKIDNGHGDRNLICSCIGIKEYE
ncbi:MAG: aminomethyl-transferring glycine dehydrogenase [Bacteroidetes bacterium]|jgi:glycine dehydrogenase|nr:aminomethyl-transferring glycine dehydrogenase [Bacteroidota bacterium]MBT4400841.1 aminomethyl-transferring glycine dehydrogenase [Bacteroidota bacterium]MBT4411864.1 aminomethyl-transferring glycine dehydrogenase [Bacteroidota bacterium]MBT7466360.1 aminomethyl-transferring glycine dehydrogenase [Bacteroidota bacterium]